MRNILNLIIGVRVIWVRVIWICAISFCVSCSTENILVKNTGFTRVDSVKTELLDVDYLSKVDFMLLDSNENAFFSSVSKVLEISDMFCL